MPILHQLENRLQDTFVVFLYPSLSTILVRMIESRVVDLLTPPNYHNRKLKMKQLLQSKALWKMLSKSQPIFTKEIEIFAYQNKLDEYMVLIGLHVSDSQLFPIVECNLPKQS